MMMPPPDGIDLLNYVRADPELFHVPVVMMSSNEHRGTVYECVKAGVDDFITKVRAAQAMPRVCRSLVADARVPNHRSTGQVHRPIRTNHGASPERWLTAPPSPSL